MTDRLERNRAIALPTWYRGVEFRSRLEARWAVFFDTLGLRWEYEKEGYDLNGLWYLPDFWIPKLDCWIEIKGGSPTKLENEKAGRLCGLTRKRVFIFQGQHTLPPENPPSSDVFYFCGAETDDHDTCYGWDCDYWFCECHMCHEIGIQYEGRTDRLQCKECYECWKFRTQPDTRHLDSYDVHQASCTRQDGCYRFGGNGDKGYNEWSDRLVQAYTSARSERFGT